MKRSNSCGPRSVSFHEKRTRDTPDKTGASEVTMGNEPFSGSQQLACKSFPPKSWCPVTLKEKSPRTLEKKSIAAVGQPLIMSTLKMDWFTSTSNSADEYSGYKSVSEMVEILSKGRNFEKYFKICREQTLHIFIIQVQ
ncbi:hypothetical protein NPIL_164351 [Nephila pilipes]|uniref:Uncharacterized protein n=1 Tax=Nephila pilipes TaxID=299642 RepID=A0A8X6Q8I4_NEPPI|nr:hypothetical protein NPIL_164351 [Nephila pilipes]